MAPGLADDIFKCILLNENCCNLIWISLKFASKGPVIDKPASVQIMALCGTSTKSWSEPMMALCTDAYVGYLASMRSVCNNIISSSNSSHIENLYISFQCCHMSILASQNTGNLTVCSRACLLTTNKHQSFTWQALCVGNPHGWFPTKSLHGGFPHKGPEIEKAFPCHNIIMMLLFLRISNCVLIIHHPGPSQT